MPAEVSHDRVDSCDRIAASGCIQQATPGSRFRQRTARTPAFADRGIAGGLAPEQARRAALLKLGHPGQLREAHRDYRGMPVLEQLAQDLRFAVRTLWKSRGFTAIAALSLALGIGANTPVFSLVDTLLLRRLPVKEPDRLVTVRRVATATGFRKP